MRKTLRTIFGLCWAQRISNQEVLQLPESDLHELFELDSGEMALLPFKKNSAKTEGHYAKPEV